jgi:hypothetical protein
MRIGYSAPWTLGEQLDRGWFGSAGSPSFKYWERVCGITVDGRTLYATHPLRRTPSAYEIRYSQKFSEVMIAACALARLDAENIAITTGGTVPQERPDLLAVIDGEQVGIEVGEVHPSAAIVNAATNLNIALNELAHRELLRPAHVYLQVHRSPGRGASAALRPATRKRLLHIMEAMLRSGAYRKWLDSGTSWVTDWAGASLGYTLYITPAPFLPKGYMKFDNGACTFNPLALTGPALRMIERKRLLAESYRSHYPLWLILGLTDEQGIFTESLHELARLALGIAPFECVIAHDGITFATYTRKGAAA